MQEILIDREQVYEGVYHVHWEIGAMRVVTDFRDEEPVTETWRTGFPPTFRFPTVEGFGWEKLDNFEMTFRAIVGEKANPFRGYGHQGMNCRQAVVTRVLRCSPLLHSHYERREPAYVGPALALSNRLWCVGATSGEVEFPALVGGVEELIRRVEAEAAPYAISRPLRTLLGRIVEASTSWPSGGPILDRLWSQALLVLRWVASPISDLQACAEAVESYYQTQGYCEEAFGWIREVVDNATPSLVDALRQSDPKARRRCAEALSWGRPANDEVIRALTASLTDCDPGVRESAAGSLGRIGPTAEASTPALIGILGDEEFHVGIVRWAIGRIDPPAEWAIPSLVKALEPDAHDSHPVEMEPKAKEKGSRAIPGDEDRLKEAREARKAKEKVESQRRARTRLAGQVRRDAAATILGNYGDAARAAIPALVEALEENPYGLSRIADSLARIDPEALVAALVKLLPRSKRPEDTIEALGRLGPKAKDAIPALIESLGHEIKGTSGSAARALAAIDLEASLAALLPRLADSDVAERRLAAEALGDMGPKAEAAVPAFIRALDDEDVEVRTFAAFALAHFGPRAAAVAALTRLVAAGPGKAREMAAWALGTIGPEAAAAVPALVEALWERDPVSRSRLIWTLGQIGPGAAAVPALVQALGDEDAAIRRAAAVALERVGPAAAAAVPALIIGLKDTGQYVRGAVARALGSIGPGPAAVRSLVEALCGPQSEGQDSIAYALGQCGSSAATAVPALIETLKDDSWGLRVSSMEALGKIGPVAIAAASRIADLLKSRGGEERSFAAWALGSFGPAAADTLPALIEALGHWDPQTRRFAALAIGSVARGDHTAIPPLMKALEDSDEEVRSAAEVALKQLRGDAE